MKILITSIICYLLTHSSLTAAVVVTWKATGIITSAANLESISSGDAFELFYTFDTLATDSVSSNTRGQYELLSVSLNISGYSGSTTTGVSGLITVDDGGFGSVDRYTLNTSSPNGFYSHQAPTISGRELISIVTQYTDNDENLFSNDSLPNTPFNLSLVESAQLELLFSNDWQSSVAFDAQWAYGTISSLTQVPVPPAAYLFVSALGLVATHTSKGANKARHGATLDSQPLVARPCWRRYVNRRNRERSQNEH